LKILYIGEFPPPNGGITLLVKCLFDELSKREDLEIQKLDIVQPRKRAKTFKLPKVLDNILAMILFQWQLLFTIGKSDIVAIHLPSMKIWTYGLYTLLLCKLFSKKLIIRKFAGTDVNGYNLVMRSITKYVLRKSDAYLCETKYLVDIAAKDEISPTFWFPNHREMPLLEAIPYRNECRRIAFLGLVRKEKGVEDLCNAAKNFVDTEIDIYGPLFGDISEEFMNGTQNITYKRSLDIDEIFDTLSQYDALILPSYREGYPGVIIEAYGVGIPVITTNLPSLKEIVDENTGIFTTPGSVDEITEAVNSLSSNNEFYLKLQKGARECADLFSVEHWANEFVGICKKTLEAK
jgi:glycosyltransferase involved in cell wall biosynthesis